MTELSLIDAIERWHAENDGERGDGHLPHVSDLAGCDRETWARRNGEPMLGHSVDTRIKFALGHAVEAHMAKLLCESLGDEWTFHQGERVVLWRDENGVGGGVLLDDEEPAPGSVVGHVDFTLRRPGDVIVVEVKSTTFFQRRTAAGYVRTPPDEAQYHYRLQAAAYAVALQAEQFCILVVCRESGQIVEFWHRTADYLAQVEDAVARVLANTEPGVEAPPAEPPAYAETKNGNWKCRYCHFLGCYRNLNAEARGVA